MVNEESVLSDVLSEVGEASNMELDQAVVPAGKNIFSRKKLAGDEYIEKKQEVVGYLRECYSRSTDASHKHIRNITGCSKNISKEMYCDALQEIELFVKLIDDCSTVVTNDDSVKRNPKGVTLGNKLVEHIYTANNVPEHRRYTVGDFLPLSYDEKYIKLQYVKDAEDREDQNEAA